MLVHVCSVGALLALASGKAEWDSCPLMDNLWVENKKMELNGIVVSIFFCIFATRIS
jgi:hypothetical protein